MKYKFLLAVTFISCAFSAFGAAKNIEDILEKHKDTIWSIQSGQCSQIFGVRFKPQDRFHNVMRYNSKGNTQHIRFAARNIPEIILYFEKNQLQSITFSIYNRGDNGFMAETAFKALGDKLERFISELTGNSEPEKESRKFDKFRIEAMTWRSSTSDYVMRRNRKGRYPEYLQLVIYPAGKAKKLRDSLKTAAKKNQLQLNLNIDENGDRYLDIPMVNQGAKGYCVGATIERIMKYYGSRIDQQIIAQLAQSDAYRGTDVRKIISVLDKHKSDLKINLKKTFDCNILTFKDLQKFTQAYNNTARKNKSKRLDFREFCVRRGNIRRLNLNALMASYQYDIFRDTCCRNKRELEKFTTVIHDSVDKGIPLAWVTFVFQNMQDGKTIGNFSFHMRIINGFNKKTNQIIYTDSWGKDHEKKYMPVNDARALTLMLLEITPK